MGTLDGVLGPIFLIRLGLQHNVVRVVRVVRVDPPSLDTQAHTHTHTTHTQHTHARATLRHTHHPATVRSMIHGGWSLRQCSFVCTNAPRYHRVVRADKRPQSRKTPGPAFHFVALFFSFLPPSRWTASTRGTACTSKRERYSGRTQRGKVPKLSRT